MLGLILIGIFKLPQTNNTSNIPSYFKPGSEPQKYGYDWIVYNYVDDSYKVFAGDGPDTFNFNDINLTNVLNPFKITEGNVNILYNCNNNPPSLYIQLYN